MEAHASLAERVLEALIGPGDEAVSETEIWLLTLVMALGPCQPRGLIAAPHARGSVAAQAATIARMLGAPSAFATETR